MYKCNTPVLETLYETPKMNEFVKSTVNYMAIAKALIQVTDETYQRNKGMFVEPDGRLIRECRTVGFTVGRQCGKSEFIRKFYQEHPGETTIIVRDDMLQRVMVAQLMNATGDQHFPKVGTATNVARYLQDLSDTPDSRLLNSRYILIDDATFCFERMYGHKRKEFYQAVYNLRRDDVTVILIN